MSSLRPLRRFSLRVLAPLAAAAALLAACGGGTSQVQAFNPERLLVLGDETGMLVDARQTIQVDGSTIAYSDGFKYGLNDGTTAITTLNAARCLLLPTPAQLLAAQYGFRFAECNPADATTKLSPAPKAFSLGQASALADDPATGLKAQVDGITGLGATDMVLFTMGTNDVIDVYAQRAGGNLANDAAAYAEVERRGKVVAGQINRVLRTGARALVITVPVLGKSPYAITAETVNPRTATNQGAAALIAELTTRFNAALRLGIDSSDFDGRNYGLVLADDVTAAMERFPGAYLSGAANKTAALCATAGLPQSCVTVDDTDTDGTGPDTDTSVRATTHLWATDRFVGPVAHQQIGAQLVSRAVNNPF